MAQSLPEYKQGEDYSMSHMQPNVTDRANITVQQAKEKVQGVIESASSNLQSLVGEKNAEALKNMETKVEDSLRSIWDYLTSTTVGEKTLEAEQWVEEEFRAAKDNLWGTMNEFYTAHFATVPMPENMKKHLAEKEKEAAAAEKSVQGASPAEWISPAVDKKGGKQEEISKTTAAL